mmetsp:Transcript_31440/g.63396  ORF Transcript_31440/g.63396 Transcript_31440/m.63396 type:complete len:750 (+) Transcript_31440:117-2366(+)|eukprot:CAMPEP_0113374502 /NCGR_PEP_ID=MMETSP0013_2-20120614/1615_1 /TAXON_ID=2843 ORGANISM="Skeletonema costatum, Strain 1716" /NCGR_SAMPLE_ID=MMETSP0013_2 /ASSEMBLY_ACC=CAM_ASM_000158 /LENGTH=749 /DNA_ID=CAMNT_0000256491 /DNA_START=41 /DNA_END=2290 /DNA_ORIENTATION=+ /assembly_acc=CAM_ASM_000158
MMDDDEDGDTIIADDLSIDGNENSTNNNEITSAEAAERRYAKQRYRSWMSMLIISTFVCSVLIASVKFFAPGRFYSEEDTTTTYDIFGSGDNGMGDSANQRRLEDALDYLVTKEISDVITLLPNNTMSPQYMAAIWISSIDQHRINIPKADGTSSKDEYPFLQRYSLAVLFLSTGGMSWIYRLNFLSGTHECAWFTVFRSDDLPPDQGYAMGAWCDKNPGTLMERDQDDNLWESAIVTDIHLLPNNNAVGRLPSELRHLRYLKTLRIYEQAFIVGEIPSGYGDLRNLQILDLEANQLGGPIPSSFKFLNKMTLLNLRRNRFTGISADAINQMDKLAALALDSNMISGKLPEFNLPNLYGLTLSDNAFTGQIPISMAGLSNLEMLALDHNKLTGSLDILEGMTHLTHVYLDNNKWDHEINNGFFAGHDNITHLDMSNCSIRGIVPDHFFKFPKLEVLDLSRNLLEGDLPGPAIASTNDTTTKLQYLSLHSNNITGPIPQGISKLKSLKHLDLSVNKMIGSINEELGELKGLEYLFLGNNDFSAGKFPAWLQNLTNLEELSLKNNNLSGEIPEWIGELTRLVLLDLGENFLNGTLPDSMGDLTKLWILILNSNNLRGSIPSSFRQLEYLETLLIDDNSFKGNTAPVCEGRGMDRITHFVSDCASNSSTSATAVSGSIGGWEDPVLAEIECECCTLCCLDEDITCNDDEWIAHHEGHWQSGYERVYWDFEENGIVSEVTDAYDTLAQAWGLP